MSDPKIVIIDYGIGNIRSMKNAFLKQGVTPIISADPGDILAADGVVLPGVGAFPKGMQNLQERGLIDPIKAYVESGKPFLGVCLGMQLLMDVGHEFTETKGLGLIPGEVKKMAVPDNSPERLPNIGWKKLIEPTDKRWHNTILKNATDQDYYFVHSYAVQVTNPDDRLAESLFGKQTFTAALQKGNIIGTQFHPEKSAVAGLQVINNFLNLC